MITLIIIVISLAFAGHFKGKLDAIVDEGLKKIEWVNKYDFTKNGNTKHWWYFDLYTPKFPERFPFSTTILVFMTDSWHRTQFFMLRCFYLAISVALTNSILMILLLSFVIFPIIVGIFFEVSYQNYRDKFKKQTQSDIDDNDGPNDDMQVTSVPEKQIEDEQN